MTPFALTVRLGSPRVLKSTQGLHHVTGLLWSENHDKLGKKENLMYMFPVDVVMYIKIRNSEISKLLYKPKVSE